MIKKLNKPMSVQSVYKSSISFHVERFEEWQGGQCTNYGNLNFDIHLIATGESISVDIPQSEKFRVHNSVTFPFLASKVLADRVQYVNAPGSSTDPNYPIVLHIFVKNEIIDCIRFAMSFPDRIIEFYGFQIESNNSKQDDSTIINSTSTDDQVRPFVFRSTCHQRYENGTPALDLQNCVRTLTLEKNVNGCQGYRITPGDGYIVKIFNNDLGKPQMSDKPMRVVSKTSEKIELRGYPLEAMSPFGWMEVDYSDYGLTVYYQSNTIYKCIFHMFDRNVDLEYINTTTESTESATNMEEPLKSKPHFEELAQQAMACLQSGKDDNEVYRPMLKAWREIQRNPSLLKDVQNKAILGGGLFVFISYGTVQDIDDRQQIISLAYLMLSDAINDNPTDLNLIRNRLFVMLQDKEALQYTVSSATHPNDNSDCWDPFFQVRGRDELITMIYSDLSKSPILRSIPILSDAFIELERLINDESFGTNRNRESIIADGIENHSKVFTYLRNKVYDNNDINF